MLNNQNCVLKIHYLKKSMTNNKPNIFQNSNLSQLSLATEYRTGDSDPVKDFYEPCLNNSNEYKRAVGFFRSSIFLIIGPAIVDFAKKNGIIHLVCSPSLTEEDVQSIIKGYETKGQYLERIILKEIDQLFVSDEAAYRTKILATLVAVGSLHIRLALRPEAQGNYHEKLGIFRDNEGNRVSFLGSANETWSGWHLRGNHEAIEVFCEWKGGSDAERVKHHDAYFERLWVGDVPGVEIVEFPEAAKKRLISESITNLENIDLDSFKSNYGKRIALPHQINAIKSWNASGKRGIFEHATGSGKTFAALLAIRDHIKKGYPALILVPSHLLLKQWEKEIKAELPDAALLIAGVGNNRWKQSGRLKGLTNKEPELGPRIILSTMQTAATDDFLQSICGGSHLMIVADEVHQIGSPYNSRIMAIDSGPRLGLSATPNRYNDSEGTNRIFEYFGFPIPPKITLNDAIKAGRLVEYEYYPHPVRLTKTESDSWKDFTNKIKFEIAKNQKDKNDKVLLTEKAKLLLIQRSRIAKKAFQKISLAAQVLKKHYEKGQRWLIYCEDSEHLNKIMEEIRKIGLSPFKYHSGMKGDRTATLAWFTSFGGILVSIKCLDEGVDIPSVSHAMILASSQNPRQFIQRRGRVLWKSPGKYIAIIHDAIVVPQNIDEEPEQLSLLKSEILRAIEFSKSSINRFGDAELRSIARKMDFDPELIGEDGIEEDE